MSMNSFVFTTRKCFFKEIVGYMFKKLIFVPIKSLLKQGVF